MQTSFFRRRNVAVAALCMACASASFAQPASRDTFAFPAARVHKAAAGEPLADARQGGLRDGLVHSMRKRGVNEATAASVVALSDDEGVSKHHRRHVRFEQRVGGLKVHGSSVKATYAANGSLEHVVERLVAISDAAPRAASVSHQQALEQVMRTLHPAADVRLRESVRGASGRPSRFAGGAFFHQEAQATTVLVPQADGSLADGFLVETWSKKGNLLDHTLVAGDGTLLNTERRTANDSYNIFPNHPDVTPQVVASGAGSGNAQSPSGWLSGAQSTVAINGNNTNTYLDADTNNRADRGGSSVSGGNFTTAANLGTAPTTTANKAVAVQNLFYLVNVVHDRLHRHGFDEAAGNFQTNNFGKGGAANDPVQAEAQDGGGVNNANFATPNDGTKPRMQMFLWNGAGPTHEAVVGGSTYAAKGATFGPAFTTTGITGNLVLGNDGVAAANGGSVNDGCEALPSTVSARVVVLDRGFCSFTLKVQNAQAAGARAVIIANNAATDIFELGGTPTTTIRIPAVMVSQADGAALHGQVNQSTVVRKKAQQPLQRDGAFDADIVYHEYGHGLTWRMIGGMSGLMAGAIGEGAADVVAFMINGDDVVGEYASGSSLGIRRYRYTGYPLTYSNVKGAEVHDDGEVYAAAMWRLRELWLGSGRSADALFDAFVDGMNYTAPTPTFEAMRNGMLDSIAATAGGDAHARCALVWDAFAQFGIGDGARAVVGSTTISVTPSTARRGDCTH